MYEKTASLMLDIDLNDTTVIVRCHGWLVAGVADVLYNRVRQLLPGSKRMVLDLTDLTRMDSMGLGTLVRLYVSARTAGCSFELINLGKQIRMLLAHANLLAAFTVAGEQKMQMG